VTSPDERHRPEKEAQQQPHTAAPTRTREQVIANTRELLDMARAGLGDATGVDPRKRRPGLMNLFTYGRSTTLAMQRMKSIDPAFEAWWKPHQERFGADPLMRYFNERRVDVIHAGELHTAAYGRIGHFDAAVAQKLNRHAPPNTIGMFFGDQLGGDGWIVRLPDGSDEKVYFQLPEDIDIETGLALLDPPTEHDGKPIADMSIAGIGAVYVNALTTLVEEFSVRFAE
jgi:hypothetical protein